MSIADDILDWLADNVIPWVLLGLFILLAVALFMAGYYFISSTRSESFTLKKEEWTCSKSADVSRTVLIPIGKVLMPQTRIYNECIQWSHK